MLTQDANAMAITNPVPPRARTDAEARAQVTAYHEWMVGTELAQGAAFLPEPERAAFLAYYRNFPKAGDAAALARYLRALWRLDTGWVSRWIAAQPRAPRILDAGSGFG